MKTKTLLAVGIIVILALVGLAGCSAAGVTAAEPQAQAQAPINVNVGNQQTGIWVSGQGKITVTPDLATLSLGVSSQMTSVAEAQSQASTAMDKVISTLTDSGIDKKDIQTQSFNIQQVTRWDDKGQQETIIGYRVSNMVIAKIRALDKVGAVIDATVAAGGDLIRINGVGFSVENPEQYYTQVRELAMNDAKAKADQIAKLAGVTLGKPSYVSENSYSPYQTPMPVMYKSMDSAGGAVPTTSISAGETDITMSVQVTYDIQ
jgi:uncharacterized protein